MSIDICYMMFYVRIHIGSSESTSNFQNGNSSSQITDQDCDTLSGLKVSKHPIAIIGTTLPHPYQYGLRGHTR